MEYDAFEDPDMSVCNLRLLTIDTFGNITLPFAQLQHEWMGPSTGTSTEELSYQRQLYSSEEDQEVYFAMRHAHCRYIWKL